MSARQELAHVARTPWGDLILAALGVNRQGIANLSDREAAETLFRVQDAAKFVVVQVAA